MRIFLLLCVADAFAPSDPVFERRETFRRQAIDTIVGLDVSDIDEARTAFFIWLFVGVWGFSEIGVWFGVACAVITGCLIALVIVERVAKREIGGLWDSPEAQEPS